MTTEHLVKDFTFDIAAHLPKDFSVDSKVWIYQADRGFMISEALELEKIFEDFVASWKSHGAPVKGFANLFFGRFIVLMADETHTQVGGCSTDSSVAMIRKIEQQFKINLLNRQNLAFYIKEKLEVIPMQQLPYAVEHGFINRDTLYFDNSIFTKKDLLSRWVTAAENTWLRRYFK